MGIYCLVIHVEVSPFIEGNSSEDQIGGTQTGLSLLDDDAAVKGNTEGCKGSAFLARIGVEGKVGGSCRAGYALRSIVEGSRQRAGLSIRQSCVGIHDGLKLCEIFVDADPFEIGGDIGVVLNIHALEGSV